MTLLYSQPHDEMLLVFWATSLVGLVAIGGAYEASVVLFAGLAGQVIRYEWSADDVGKRVWAGLGKDACDSVNSKSVTTDVLTGEAVVVWEVPVTFLEVGSIWIVCEGIIDAPQPPSSSFNMTGHTITVVEGFRTGLPVTYYTLPSTTLTIEVPLWAKATAVTYTLKNCQSSSSFVLLDGFTIEVSKLVPKGGDVCMAASINRTAYDWEYSHLAIIPLVTVTAPQEATVFAASTIFKSITTEVFFAMDHEVSLVAGFCGKDPEVSGTVTANGSLLQVHDIRHEIPLALCVKLANTSWMKLLDIFPITVVSVTLRSLEGDRTERVSVGGVEAGDIVVFSADLFLISAVFSGREAATDLLLRSNLGPLERPLSIPSQGPLTDHNLTLATTFSSATTTMSIHSIPLIATWGTDTTVVSKVPTAVPPAELQGYNFSLCGYPDWLGVENGSWWVNISSRVDLCFTTAQRTYQTGVGYTAAVVKLAGVEVSEDAVIPVAAEEWHMDGTIPQAVSVSIGEAKNTIKEASGIVSVKGGWTGRVHTRTSSKLPWSQTRIFVNLRVVFREVGQTWPKVKVSPTIGASVLVVGEGFDTGCSLYFSSDCKPRSSANTESQVTFATDTNTWRTVLLLDMYITNVLLCFHISNTTRGALTAAQVSISGLISILSVPPPVKLNLMSNRSNAVPIRYITDGSASLYASEETNTCVQSANVDVTVTAELLVVYPRDLAGRTLILCTAEGVFTGLTMVILSNVPINGTIQLLSHGVSQVAVGLDNWVVLSDTGCPPAKGIAIPVTSGVVSIRGTDTGEGVICLGLEGDNDVTKFFLEVARYQEVVFRVHGATLGEPLFVAESQMETLVLESVTGLPERIAVGHTCATATVLVWDVFNTVVHLNTSTVHGMTICVSLHPNPDLITTGITITPVTASLQQSSIPTTSPPTRVGLLSGATEIGIVLMSSTMHLLEAPSVSYYLGYRDTLAKCDAATYSVTPLSYAAGLWVSSYLPVVNVEVMACLKVIMRGHSTVAYSRQSLTLFPVNSIGAASAAQPLLPLLVGIPSEIKVSYSELGDTRQYYIGTTLGASEACTVQVVTDSSVVLLFEEATRTAPYYLCLGDNITAMYRLDVKTTVLSIALSNAGGKSVALYQNNAAELTVTAHGTEITARDTRAYLIFSLQPVASSCKGNLESFSAPIFLTSCGKLHISSDRTANKSKLALCVAAQLSPEANRGHFVDMGLRVEITEPSRLMFVVQPADVLPSGVFLTQPTLAIFDANLTKVSLGSDLTVRAVWSPEPPQKASYLWTASTIKNLQDTSEIDFQSIDGIGIQLLGYFGVPYVLHVSVISNAFAFETAVSSPVMLTDCADKRQFAPLLERSCVECPSGALCKGNTTIFADKNFWRANTNVFTFYKCPFDGVCNMGSCSPGHTGALCSVCEPGYGLSGSGCVLCKQKWRGILLLTFFGVVGLVWISILVASTLQAAQNILNPVPMMLKITLNHLVVSSRLGDFSSEFPALLTTLFSIQNEASSFGMNSMSDADCATKSALSTYHVFVLWMMVPLFIMVGTWFIPLCIWIYRAVKKWMGTKEEKVEEDHGDDSSAGSEEDVTDNPVLYLKIQFVKVRGGAAADAVSISGVRLRRGAQELDTTDYMIDNPEGSCPEGCGCENLTDGVSETCWVDYYKKPLVVTLAKRQNVSGISFTTSPSNPERDPVRWAVYWSADGRVWDRVNNQFKDFATTTARDEHLPWFHLLPSRGGLVHVYVVSVIILLYVAYPIIIEKAAVMISCDRIDLGTDLNNLTIGATPVSPSEILQDGDTFYTRRATVDRSLSCNTDQHFRYMVAANVFLVLYGLGMPLGIGCVVYLMRRYKGKRNAFTLFHFLVSGLNKRRWYWELLTMIRKMLIIVLINFVEAGRLQTYLAMWVISVYLVLTLLMRPFNTKMPGKPHELELASLSIISVTLNLSLLYDHVSRPSSDDIDCPTISFQESCLLVGCTWDSVEAVNATGCSGSGSGNTWVSGKQTGYYILTGFLFIINIGFFATLMHRLVPRLVLEYSMKLKIVWRKYPWMQPLCFRERIAAWIGVEEEEQKANRRVSRVSITGMGNPLVAPHDEFEEETEADEGPPDVGDVDEWSSDSDDPQHDARDEDVIRMRNEIKRQEDLIEYWKTKHKRDLADAEQEQFRLNSEVEALQQTAAKAEMLNRMRSGIKKRIVEAKTEQITTVLESLRTTDILREDVREVLSQPKVAEIVHNLMKRYGTADDDLRMTVWWSFWCFVCDVNLQSDHKAIQAELEALEADVTIHCTQFVVLLANVAVRRNPHLNPAFAAETFFLSIPQMMHGISSTATCLIQTADRDAIGRHLCLHKADHPVLRKVYPRGTYYLSWFSLKSLLVSSGLYVDEAMDVFRKAVKTTTVLLPNQFVELVFCIAQIRSAEPWLTPVQVIDDAMQDLRKATNTV